MFHHLGISQKNLIRELFIFLCMNIMANIVQEGHGLLRKFVTICMVLYVNNYLSRHVKIYMIICIDYMFTTNATKNQLVQQILSIVVLYKMIKL